jgi:hypothetical protein
MPNFPLGRFEEKIIVFGCERHVKVEEKDISNGDYKNPP